MPKTSWSKDLKYTFWNRQYWKNVTYPNNVTTYTANSASVSTVIRTNFGYKDTDWKTKVARKQNASSNQSYAKHVVYMPYIQMAETAGAWWNPSQQRFDIRVSDINYTGMGVSLVGQDPFDLDLQALALKRFKQKAADYSGNANLVVPTIELRELRKLLRDSAGMSRRMIEAMHYVLRKKRGTAKLIDRLAKDLWLTYSFGIAPTIADTMKAIKAIDNFFDRSDVLRRISGRASKTFRRGRIDFSGDSFRFTRTVQTSCDYKLTYSYVGGIRHKTVSANSYSLQEHLGFSSLWEQVPSVAWEVMPFSWVFDYFTTMGDFLEDTFVTPTYQMVWLDLSRHMFAVQRDRADVIFGKYGSEPIPLLMRSRCLPSLNVFVNGERTAQTTLPTAQLRIKSVDEVGRNAVNKLLNLASILRSK